MHAHAHTLYNRNKIPANDYAVLAVALQYVKRKDLPVSPSHSELCYISACVESLEIGGFIAG